MDGNGKRQMHDHNKQQAILQGLAKHGKHGCWCMSLDPNQQWIRVVGQHTRGKNNGWSGGEQTAQGGNVKECNICKGNVRQESGEEEEHGMDENRGRAKEGRTKGDKAREEECEKSRG